MKRFFSDDFRTTSGESLAELEAYARRFCGGLKERGVKEFGILTNDSVIFLTALFGACYAGVKIAFLQVAKFDGLIITADNFSDFLGTLDEVAELNLDTPFGFRTSGSSGEPKEILKTFRQMVDEAEFLVGKFGFNKTQTMVANTPLVHLFGLTFRGFCALVGGVRVESELLLYPDEVFEFCKNNENVTLISTTMVLKKLCESTNLSKMRNLKQIFTAGNRLDKSVRERLLAALPELKVVEIYGSSETGVMAYDVGGGLTKFSGVSARVLDGRLQVASKWQDVGDGVPFLTSDRAEIYGDKIRLLGRCDRLVKLHEKRVSLDGAQAALCRCKFLADAFVGHFEGEKRLYALVELNAAGREAFLNGGKRAVVSECKKSLGDEFGAVVRYFKILEKLPYERHGKISRMSAESAFLARVEPKFELVKKSDECVELKTKVSPEWFYFDGHFNVFPLTPGFVQMGWAVRFVKEFWGVSVRAANQVKFSAFLRPFDDVFVSVFKSGEKFGFEVRSQNGKCCSGRI